MLNDVEILHYMLLPLQLFCGGHKKHCMMHHTSSMSMALHTHVHTHTHKTWVSFIYITK
jgi:hypothetical protein